MKHQRKRVHYVLAGVLLTFLAVVVLALVFIKPVERYVNYRIGLEALLDTLAPELDPWQVTKIEYTYLPLDATHSVDAETTDRETIDRIVELWNEAISRKPKRFGSFGDPRQLEHELELSFYCRETELLRIKTAAFLSGSRFDDTVDGPWELWVRGGTRCTILCWESSQETFREVAALLGAELQQ